MFYYDCANILHWGTTVCPQQLSYSGLCCYWSYSFPPFSPTCLIFYILSSSLPVIHFSQRLNKVFLHSVNSVFHNLKCVLFTLFLESFLSEPPFHVLQFSLDAVPSHLGIPLHCHRGGPHASHALDPLLPDSTCSFLGLLPCITGLLPPVLP